MTISFSHKKFTFFAIFLFTVYQNTNGQFLYQDCYDDFGQYSILSDYESNINKAITQLTTLASTSYFNTVSVGKGVYKVYALFYCRYDVTSEVCNSCVESTLEKVPLCFRSVESIQFYQDCTLHYSNVTFFSVMEDLPRYSIHGLDIVDDIDFNTFLSTTIEGLISDKVAEFGVSSRYFATVEKEYSVLKMLYALAQCNADISSDECNECLKNGFGNFTKNYRGAFMGQVFMPSCRLSYMLSNGIMTSPYDFNIKIVDTPSIPPISTPDGDSTRPPPPPSDDALTSPPPSIFVDEALPPPYLSSMTTSAGTRSSITVASFFIAVLSFGPFLL